MFLQFGRSPMVYVYDNEPVPRSRNLQGPLRICNIEMGKGYIRMIDPDAPYPSRAQEEPFVHFQFPFTTKTGCVDVPKTVRYVPPSPPSDSPPHRYLVQISPLPTFDVIAQDFLFTY